MVPSFRAINGELLSEYIRPRTELLLGRERQLYIAGSRLCLHSRDVRFLALCEYADPAPAQGTRTREEFEATQAEAEVLYEGVHFWRLARRVCWITFPEDYIRVCKGAGCVYKMHS